MTQIGMFYTHALIDHFYCVNSFQGYVLDPIYPQVKSEQKNCKTNWNIVFNLDDRWKFFNLFKLIALYTLIDVETYLVQL